MKTMYLLSLMFILSLVVLGCSGTDNTPTAPAQQSENTGITAATDSQYVLWGMWDWNFDLDKLEINAVPVRGPEAHFNVTSKVQPPECYDCLALAIAGFNPVTRIMNVNVTLKNPTVFTGRDVRGILYTNQFGHMITNPDDWTPIYDIVGGDTINPFKAFAKDQNKRSFVSGAKYSENYLVYIPKPPYYGNIKYAVTAVWPGSAREPYMIDDFQQLDDIPAYTGSSGDVQVSVYDWQDDVDYVRLYAEEITGDEYTEFANTSGNIWQLTLVNYQGVSAGDYTVMIKAHSEGTTDIALYDFATVTISELPPAKGWARNYPGGHNDIAFDANQNIYVAGSGGTGDYDPGAGVADYETNGGSDCVLLKFDQYGNFQWMRGWGGTDNESCNAVDTDPSGNIYVSGTFRGTVDFDPTAGVDEYTALQDYSAFISKYDGDGNYLWTRAWGYKGAPEYRALGQDVVVGDASSIYVTGYYNGTVDFDPGPEEDLHTGPGNDLYLSKFNENGDFQWAITLGAASVIPEDIKTDTSGNIYIAGHYSSGNVDFDPDPVDSDVHVAEWHQSSFLAKYLPDGDYAWALTWGLSNQHDEAYGVCLDDNGNIYVTGYFEGTIDIDPGPGVYEVTVVGSQDAYLVKFAPAGILLWVLTWGGGGNDIGYSVENYGTSDVYVSGGFWHTMDFDPDPVDEDIKPGSDLNMLGFLSKFDTSGDYQWGWYWGGGVYYSNNAVNQVRVWQPTGDVFITGYIAGAVDFDPGPTEDIHDPSNGGGCYLAKYTSDGTW